MKFEIEKNGGCKNVNEWKIIFVEIWNQLAKKDTHNDKIIFSNFGNGQQSFWMWYCFLLAKFSIWTMVGNQNVVRFDGNNFENVELISNHFHMCQRRNIDVNCGNNLGRTQFEIWKFVKKRVNNIKTMERNLLVTGWIFKKRLNEKMKNVTHNFRLL